MVETVWVHSGELQSNKRRGQRLLEESSFDGHEAAFLSGGRRAHAVLRGDGNHMVPYPTYPQHHG